MPGRAEQDAHWRAQLAARFFPGKPAFSPVIGRCSSAKMTRMLVVESTQRANAIAAAEELAI
jgi:hypothetical protein